MTYVIAEPCIDIKDRSCVDVCPVDGIHEFERILIIDPEECIDCGAREPECPVEAIFPEDALPEKWQPFVQINYAYPDANPINSLVDEYARCSNRCTPASDASTRERLQAGGSRRSSGTCVVLHVFISGDRLHGRSAPLFLTPDQSYIEASEFKAGLREIDDHYDQLPDEIKQLGVLQFAHYPPSNLDNVVTRLWDKHMRPDWREIAAAQEGERGKLRDEGTDRKTLADMKGRVESAEPVAEAETPLTGDEADYVIIRRQVPVKKGKWRMVSKEVEEAEEDDGASR